MRFSIWNCGFCFGVDFRSEMAKDHLHFILVRTQFASNLGAAARILKNMGFGRLVLIRPRCEVGAEARMMAMKGAELVDNAVYYPSLHEARRQIRLLVGTTARSPKSGSRRISSRTLAGKLVPRFRSGPLGIVFGPEDNGLSREELQLCEWLVEIPTAGNYPVLNLAQAVGLVAYDLHLASREPEDIQFLHLAEPAEVQSLIAHLEAVLTAAVLPPHLSRQRILARLNRILGRAQLEKEDVKLLRSLLALVSRSHSENRRVRSRGSRE